MDFDDYKTNEIKKVFIESCNVFKILTNQLPEQIRWKSLSFKLETLFLDLYFGVHEENIDVSSAIRFYCNIWKHVASLEVKYYSYYFELIELLQLESRNKCHLLIEENETIDLLSQKQTLYTYELIWYIMDNCTGQVTNDIFNFDRQKIRDVINNSEPENIKIPTLGFRSGLSDEELKGLYQSLVNQKYLDSSSAESHFLNAFKGLPLESNFVKLRWIDKPPKNNAPANFQTLLELLYLLEMSKQTYDTLPSNKNNFYRLIENVFEGVANIQAKNKKGITQDSDRKIELKKILEQIRFSN
jgi:hypothetical protein